MKNERKYITLLAYFYFFSFREHFSILKPMVSLTLSICMRSSLMGDTVCVKVSE